jgi:DNA (cytosine-5)-methyltransferase 1
MMCLRFGSVCSGIEAASVAWHPLGWRAAFVSEIDRFPCAVLAHHYPDVPNVGDMTKFQEWPDYAIDVLVGGTPCQSFSVAGLRKGLADARGNLMLTYLAIAARYRPAWLVWENVPGVLSSNGGRDFGALLGGLAELGYGFAYRVLDAQYFGLAQRRKRVFVVGCLGNWRRAAAVLFERESLSGHPAPRRQSGQIVAPTIAGSSNGGGANGPGRDADSVESTTMVAFHNRQDPDVSGDVTHPLGAQDNGMGIQCGMRVRRLTPKECCRLQGFPDDYLDIIYRGKPAGDGPRYKALGNSMAVPVMHWIGKRIQRVNEIGGEQ